MKGRLQIVYWLLCTTEGRPIAIEVFDGNTADPKTLAAQIKALVEADAMQLSLFDEHNLFQITHLDYPSERLVCCRNPALAAQRARKRDELLAATDTELDKIAAATQRDMRPLRGKDTVGLRVDALAPDT